MCGIGLPALEVLWALQSVLSSCVSSSSPWASPFPRVNTHRCDSVIWDTDSALDTCLQAEPVLQRVTRRESKTQVLQEVSTGDLPFPSVSVRSAWIVLL